MNYETFFDKMSSLIELDGQSYDITKKLLIYSLLGNVIKHNPITLGKLKQDTRVNLGIPIRSGYGKSVCKNFIRKTERQLGLPYSEPTSLHPEQLVGKTIIIRDRAGQIVDTIINKGHLADDYITFDEAIELLTERSYQQARDYINIALDPIGYNEIYKRSVDSEVSQAVRYCPEVTMAFFFHPVPIPNSVINRGFLRRVFITYLNPTDEERRKALASSLKPSYNSSLFDEWIALLKEMKNKKLEWKFTEPNLIINYTQKLIQRGLTYSPKVADFTDIMYFTLRDRLVKLACILAGLDHSPKVQRSHIVQAYRDMREFWDAQATYVEEHVITKLIGAFRAREKHRVCIEILKERGAISEEASTLSIDELLTEMSRRLSISKGAARYYYLQLVKAKVVGAKKYSHSSKVWLIKSDLISPKKEIKLWEKTYDR